MGARSLRNINVTIAAHLFIAMLGTFFLVHYITKDTLSSFIAGLSIISSGFFLSMVGLLPFLNSLGYFAFILLFLAKAMESNWTRNTIFASIFLCLVFLSGGASNAVWFVFFILPMLALYYMFYLKKYKEIFFIIIVFLTLGIGLAAIRLLSAHEFMTILGTRSIFRYTYSEFIGAHVPLSDMFSSIFIKRSTIFIGIIPVMFILSSFFKKPDKKYFLPIFSLTLIVILIGLGTSIDRLLYNFPVIQSLKNVEKVTFILPIFIAILFGISYKKISREIPFIKNSFAVALIIIVFLAQTLVLLPHGIKIDFDVPSLEFLSKEIDEPSRVNKIDEAFAGTSFCNKMIKYPNIHTSDWCTGSLWDISYVDYRFQASGKVVAPILEQLPKYLPLMHGILNAKYLISPYDLEDKFPDLEFIKNFPEESISIYENKKFLPRFYAIDKAVLLFGDRLSATKYLFTLIQDGLVNPKKYVLIISDDISEIDLDMVDLIITTDKNIPVEILQRIKNNPETVYPSNYYINKSISDALLQLNGSLLPVEIIKSTDSKVQLHLPAKFHQGYIVASEKYFEFDDWQATVDGSRKKILNAYNVISAVQINDQSKFLTFAYKPKMFYLGLIITFLELVLIFLILKKEKK